MEHTKPRPDYGDHRRLACLSPARESRAGRQPDRCHLAKIRLQKVCKRPLPQGAADTAPGVENGRRQWPAGGLSGLPYRVEAVALNEVGLDRDDLGAVLFEIGRGLVDGVAAASGHQS